MCRRRGQRALFSLAFLLSCVTAGTFLIRRIAEHFKGEMSIYLQYYDQKRTCTDQDPLWKHVRIVREGAEKEIKVSCIPSVPRISTLGFIPVLDSSLSEKYLKLPSGLSYTDHVTILCPLRDSARYLPAFVHRLSMLSYPHHLISIHFGEEGSSDNTFEIAAKLTERLMKKHGFKNAKVYKLPIKGNKTTRKTRHKKSKQLQRRTHMAKARNLLTKYSLKDEHWVLWIDSDVISFRPDVIQQFLYSNKDVMVASALREYTYFGNIRVYRSYDHNTFRERIENGKQTRLYPEDLKAEGREAKVDYVGACMLMIRADCLREGLQFTEHPYNPNMSVDQLNIESEGLGKLARDMGFSVYTLPFLEVVHV